MSLESFQVLGSLGLGTWARTGKRWQDGGVLPRIRISRGKIGESGLGGSQRQVRGRLQTPVPKEVGHQRNYEAKYGCGLESAGSFWLR